MDVPARPGKSDFLYTNFLPNFPPISIPFSKGSTQFWPNWVLFTIICPKYTQFYTVWVPLSLMKTPRSLYQISWKSAPKGRHIYAPYTMSMWEPPPLVIRMPIISREIIGLIYTTWTSINNQRSRKWDYKASQNVFFLLLLLLPHRPQSTVLQWIQTDSSWQLNLFFLLQIFKHLNLKMFTVIITVHDRVKESFEPTVLQILRVGFYGGL